MTMTISNLIFFLTATGAFGLPFRDYETQKFLSEVYFGQRLQHYTCESDEHHPVWRLLSGEEHQGSTARVEKVAGLTEEILKCYQGLQEFVTALITWDHKTSPKNLPEVVRPFVHYDADEDSDLAVARRGSADGKRSATDFCLFGCAELLLLLATQLNDMELQQLADSSDLLHYLPLHDPAARADVRQQIGSLFGRFAEFDFTGELALFDVLQRGRAEVGPASTVSSALFNLVHDPGVAQAKRTNFVATSKWRNLFADFFLPQNLLSRSSLPREFVHIYVASERNMQWMYYGRGTTRGEHLTTGRVQEANAAGTTAVVPTSCGSPFLNPDFCRCLFASLTKRQLRRRKSEIYEALCRPQDVRHQSLFAQLQLRDDDFEEDVVKNVAGFIDSATAMARARSGENSLVSSESASAEPQDAFEMDRLPFSVNPQLMVMLRHDAGGLSKPNIGGDDATKNDVEVTEVVQDDISENAPLELDALSYVFQDCHVYDQTGCWDQDSIVPILPLERRRRQETYLFELREFAKARAREIDAAVVRVKQHPTMPHFRPPDAINLKKSLTMQRFREKYVVEAVEVENAKGGSSPRGELEDRRLESSRVSDSYKPKPTQELEDGQAGSTTKDTVLEDHQEHDRLEASLVEEHLLADLFPEQIAAKATAPPPRPWLQYYAVSLRDRAPTLDEHPSAVDPGQLHATSHQHGYQFVGFGMHTPFLTSVAKTLSLSAKFYFDFEVQWRLEGNIYMCETLSSADGGTGKIDFGSRGFLPGTSPPKQNLQAEASPAKKSSFGATLVQYEAQLQQKEVGDALVNPACFGREETAESHPAKSLTPAQAFIHFWARNFERPELFGNNVVPGDQNSFSLADIAAELRHLMRENDEDQVDAVLCADWVVGCVLLAMALGEQKQKMILGDDDSASSAQQQKSYLPLLVVNGIGLLEFTPAAFHQEVLQWVQYFASRPATILAVAHEQLNPLFRYQTAGINFVLMPLLCLSVFEDENKRNKTSRGRGGEEHHAGNSQQITVAHPLEALFPHGRPLYYRAREDVRNAVVLASSNQALADGGYPELQFPSKDPIVIQSAGQAPMLSSTSSSSTTSTIIVLRAPFFHRKEGHWFKALCERLEPMVSFKWMNPELFLHQHEVVDERTQAATSTTTEHQSSEQQLVNMRKKSGINKEFSSSRKWTSFSDITSADLAVYMPSEPSLMKFKDVYSAAVPIAVPDWPWATRIMMPNAAQIGYTTLFEKNPPLERTTARSAAAVPLPAVPPLETPSSFRLQLPFAASPDSGDEQTPFYKAGKDTHDKLLFWNRLSDAERMPFVLRFSSVAELLVLVKDTDLLLETSRNMRQYFFGRVVANSLALYRNLFAVLASCGSPELVTTRGFGVRRDEVDQDARLNTKPGRFALFSPTRGTTPDAPASVARTKKTPAFLTPLSDAFAPLIGSRGQPRIREFCDGAQDWGRCALLRARLLTSSKV
ncbi:unnamed protein product [Amoebophrya sp. A120]|nr:unnamed protein product [Amoebophrya sp. A120]|eukprot:GSA120T00003713001.1